MLIDDTTNNDILYPPDRSRGLIARDYKANPVGSYAGAPAFAIEMPTIPRSEWSARIKELKETKSRLSDIRRGGNYGQPIPSLDQDGWGYCWAHSTTHAVTLVRAVNNQSYIPLSAFAVAATIKNGRDEGGWGALSMEFIQQRGVPSQAYWPQQDAKLSHGTEQCWANAAQHKVTEGWVDLSEAVYDRDLTFDQVATCLLCRIPVVGDYSWWSHSVCLMDLEEVEPGSFGVRILNSWSDQWGDLGESVLQGSRAIPDGAVAARVATASLS